MNWLGTKYPGHYLLTEKPRLMVYVGQTRNWLWPPGSMSSTGRVRRVFYSPLICHWGLFVMFFHVRVLLWIKQPGNANFMSERLLYLLEAHETGTIVAGILWNWFTFFNSAFSTGYIPVTNFLLLGNVTGNMMPFRSSSNLSMLMLLLICLSSPLLFAVDSAALSRWVLEPHRIYATTVSWMTMNCFVNISLPSWSYGRTHFSNVKLRELHRADMMNIVARNFISLSVPILLITKLLKDCGISLHITKTVLPTLEPERSTPVAPYCVLRPNTLSCYCSPRMTLEELIDVHILEQNILEKLLQAPAFAPTLLPDPPLPVTAAPLPPHAPPKAPTPYSPSHAPYPPPKMSPSPKHAPYSPPKMPTPTHAPYSPPKVSAPAPHTSPMHGAPTPAVKSPFFPPYKAPSGPAPYHAPSPLALAPGPGRPAPLGAPQVAPVFSPAGAPHVAPTPKYAPHVGPPAMAPTPVPAYSPGEVSGTHVRFLYLAKCCVVYLSCWRAELVRGLCLFHSGLPSCWSPCCRGQHSVIDFRQVFCTHLNNACPNAGFDGAQFCSYGTSPQSHVCSCIITQQLWPGHIPTSSTWRHS